MPRSLWTGSLSFGLVNVPVQMFTAVRDQGIHFRQLHAKDAAPIETRRVCSKEEVEVPWEEVAHGFETDDGKLIVLTDEELAAADPRRTRTIDIEAFVDLPTIDPIWFDHPYWLAPQGESEGTVRAYRLLVEAMAGSERVALGRVVMRTKEYLVAIRSRDGRLALSTLLWHDEVRPAKDVDTGGAKKPSKKELEQAVALVDGLTVDWDPSRYEDRYRQRLKKVIAAKKKGKTVKLPEEPEREREGEAAPDLMAALEQSIADMEKARKPKSGGRATRRKKAKT
jgi:DNA end-binding protein Ku